ncbi:succinate dehydrogenase assembly factor 2 [Sulfuriflexus mobilis]|uniref:FAD assembly factor SdhE n=1 Tax=Sulfuriflexus mobilis TaxID=1811807 RepID=UPI000F83D13C|nr:succinate dehydrogenase assembly factor 2 [Sulfuriflexus mobilis]
MMTADTASAAHARLYWQCRRGMLELDTLLQGFLERGYAALDRQGQQSFNALLDCPDTELLEYLMGRQRHREVHINHVIEAIRRCAAP